MKKLVVFLILVLMVAQSTLSFATSNASATRLSGANRYVTSLEVAKKVNPNPDTVVLAYGQNYPDAIAGSVLTINNIPMILVNKNSIPSDMHSYISKADNAIILGGYGALSASIEEELASLGVNNVQRLRGSNRYETAVAISNYVGNTDGYILASGSNYPDAISGSVLTYQDGEKYPILLTPKNALPNSVKNKIQNAEKVYILGGKGVISQNVENELNQLNVQEIIRLGGKNRYETALKICKEVESPDKIALVSGRNFPDALSASALATKHSAPVLLSEKDSLPAGQGYLYNNNPTINEAFIVGGSGVIGGAVLDEVESLIRGGATNESHFIFDSSSKTITGYKSSGPKFVIVPSQINGVNVEKIGEKSFMRNDLKGVVITSGIKAVHKEAFDSNYITDLTLPNTLELIDSSAFSNNNLTALKLPSSLKNINSRAFIDNNISAVYLPDGINYVGPNAFMGKDKIHPQVTKSGSNLTFFINGDGVLTSYFGNSKSVTIPSGVNTIGEYAFNANGITDVTIPQGVSVIEDSAFWDNKITSLTLPNSITEIQSYAFCYNNIASPLTIPSSVNSLGEYSFVSNNLTVVSVPAGLDTTNVFDEGVTINQN